MVFTFIERLSDLFVFYVLVTQVSGFCLRDKDENLHLKNKKWKKQNSTRHMCFLPHELVFLVKNDSPHILHACFSAHILHLRFSPTAPWSEGRQEIFCPSMGLKFTIPLRKIEHSLRGYLGYFRLGSVLYFIFILTKMEFCIGEIANVLRWSK